MKGIILSEFIEFLEQQLGYDTAQKIIDQSGVSSQGAYTRVGHYDYQELIQLLMQTATETEQSADQLLQPFADHLFKMFRRDYAVFFDQVASAPQMLTRIDNHIHVEVKKLYPDAELPKFEYLEKDDLLILNYVSPRPLADVANALVNSCLSYFDDGSKLVDVSLADDRCSAQFIIKTSIE